MFSWDEDDLISLPADLPLLWKLVKELSQPTMTHNSRMKLLIDKRPEGTKSPNLADALVMLYFPMRVRKPMNITAEVLAQARVGGRR
jgi:phage terminase large subunit